MVEIWILENGVGIRPPRWARAEARRLQRLETWKPFIQDWEAGIPFEDMAEKYKIKRSTVLARASSLRSDGAKLRRRYRSIPFPISKRACQVVLLRLNGVKTYTEIGRRLGISSTRVRQLWRKFECIMYKALPEKETVND